MVRTLLRRPLYKPTFSNHKNQQIPVSPLYLAHHQRAHHRVIIFSPIFASYPSATTAICPSPSGQLVIIRNHPTSSPNRFFYWFFPYPLYLQSGSFGGPRRVYQPKLFPFYCTKLYEFKFTIIAPTKPDQPVASSVVSRRGWVKRLQCSPIPSEDEPPSINDPAHQVRTSSTR